jgi:hypothetical protein
MGCCTSDQGTSALSMTGPARSQRRKYTTEIPQSQFAKGAASCDLSASLNDIRQALKDARIPNVGVSANGNTIRVDGVDFTINAQGRLEGAGEDLSEARFKAAVGKLVMLRNVQHQLSFYDANNATAVVIKNADGTLTMKAKAKVRIDPNRDQQAKFVLTQLKQRGQESTAKTMVTA